MTQSSESLRRVSARVSARSRESAFRLDETRDFGDATRRRHSVRRGCGESPRDLANQRFASTKREILEMRRGDDIVFGESSGSLVGSLETSDFASRKLHLARLQLFACDSRLLSLAHLKLVILLRENCIWRGFNSSPATLACSRWLT